MATKVIILGEEPREVKKLKPIEFKWLWERADKISGDMANPNQWSFIELIAPKYQGGYDLMFAYDSPEHRNLGACFLGHFNDGVVE